MHTLQKPFRISDLIAILNESLTGATSEGAADAAVHPSLPLP